MRHLIAAATLATLLLVHPAVARAESWILWGADKWDPRPWQSLGVYADRAACTTAARPTAETRAKEIAAEARAQDKSPVMLEDGQTTTPSLGPAEAVENPPGTRIVVTVVRRLSKGSLAGQSSSPRFVVLTQCWPAGVTPR